MRRVLILVGVLLALAALLVWQAPATWLDAALRYAGGDTLTLADTQGSVWSGNGELQALLPRGEAVAVARVRWKLAFEPASGLEFRLVSSRDDRPLLAVGADLSGIRIDALRLDLPAALLGAASPTLRQADLDGRIELSATHLAYRDGRLAGQMALTWRAAASGLTPLRPLGDYRIAFNGKGDALDIQVTSLGTPVLALAGSGRWPLAGKPTLSITATPAPDRHTALAPLLRMIGRESAPGVYQLQLAEGVGAL